MKDPLDLVRADIDAAVRALNLWIEKPSRTAKGHALLAFQEALDTTAYAARLLETTSQGVFREATGGRSLGRFQRVQRALSLENGPYVQAVEITLAGYMGWTFDF